MSTFTTLSKHQLHKKNPPSEEDKLKRGGWHLEFTPAPSMNHMKKRIPPCWGVNELEWGQHVVCTLPPFLYAIASIIPPNEGETNLNRASMWVSCWPLLTMPQVGIRGAHMCHPAPSSSSRIPEDNNGVCHCPHPPCLLIKNPGNDDKQVVIIPLLPLPPLTASWQTKERKQDGVWNSCHLVIHAVGMSHNEVVGIGGTVGAPSLFIMVKNLGNDE